MHYIDPEHYPTPNSGYGGKTYDLDQVYTHEVLHGLGITTFKNSRKRNVTKLWNNGGVDE